jgi:hypothetical protein
MSQAARDPGLFGYCRKLDLEFGGEFFSLSENSAQDQRRYDFLKDVQRLEQVVSEGFVYVSIA